MTTSYAASNSLPMSALPTASGILQRFPAQATNTGASTYAPDGLTASPIFGLGGKPLEGNEIVFGGNVTLVSYIGPLLNSGALCWVLLDCTGGAQQIASATQNEQAVQFGQLTGLIGSMRNAKMSIATGSASALFTADQVVVGTALSGLQYLLPSFSQTINLTITGAGGMDVGSAPTPGFVALYAIYNPVTQTASVLATNATDSIVPSIYVGNDMPAGYTASALISVWATDATAKFELGFQVDRKVFTDANTVLVTNVQSDVLVPLSLASTVPPNAKTVWGGYNVGSSEITNITARIASSVTAIAQIGISGPIPSPGEAIANPFPDIPLITQQTIFHLAQASDGTISWQIGIAGYSF